MRKTKIKPNTTSIVKIDMGKIIKKAITGSERNIAEMLVKQMTNFECLPEQSCKILGDSFEKAVIERTKDLTGFLGNAFEKWFLDNLTTQTDIAFKNYFANNKEIGEKIDTYLDKYLKEINFEQITLDFFQSKKELFMEMFLKTMFKDKK